MSTNISFNHSLAFNQGIIPMEDDLRIASKELPQQAKISPANLAYLAQVDELLVADGAQALLRNWVRPQLDKMELLEPGVFSDVLNASLQTIRQNLKGAPPEDVQRLKSASRILEDQVQLRDYSLMMTMALYEG
jgi:hypothetical protein